MFQKDLLQTLITFIISHFMSPLNMCAKLMHLSAQNKSAYRFIWSIRAHTYFFRFFFFQMALTWGIVGQRKLCKQMMYMIFLYFRQIMCQLQFCLLVCHCYVCVGVIHCALPVTTFKGGLQVWINNNKYRRQACTRRRTCMPRPHVVLRTCFHLNKPIATPMLTHFKCEAFFS